MVEIDDERYENVFFVMLCIPFCKHKPTSIDARLNMMCVIWVCCFYDTCDVVELTFLDWESMKLDFYKNVYHNSTTQRKQ